MKQKILIVDDSPLVREMYGTELKVAGYDVVSAEDGFKAINAALQEMPDLILLDINMPRVNGYQVCRLLKDHAATKHIPIVIETSRSSSAPVKDPKRWSFETGADGFIDKGEHETLKEVIEKFIGPQKPKKTFAKTQKPMSEMEVMTALSHLLDKQLYDDVTHLQDLNQKKSAFVANVAHEFKSPLAVIKGSIENMCMGIMGPVTERQKKSLHLSVHTVNRLNRLIMDLLDISRIEAGKMTLDFELLNLVHLVDEVLETYALALNEKEIELKKEIKCTEAQILGDKDRLMQVVINLLSNSIKFTPKGGVIIIRVNKDDNQNVRFEIQDNGVGMSPESLEKIFDMFEQIDPEKGTGTGLGLAIAKDLIVLHHGKLWVESKLTRGSNFIFTLPQG